MLGVEAYLLLAVILAGIGFWRERPGWFALSALLCILAMYASHFVLTGCTYDTGSWVCHYTKRPDILVGALTVFLVNMFGLYLYGIKQIARVISTIRGERG